MYYVKKNAKDISDVTLAFEDDKDNSDTIECALEMVGMEFFNVTVATGDHNEDSVSRVNKNKNVKKIQAVINNKIFNRSPYLPIHLQLLICCAHGRNNI